MPLPMARPPPRLPGSEKPLDDSEQVRTIALQWISRFSRLVGEVREQKNNPGVTAAELRSKIQQLFHENGYWRDLVCLSWDFHTLSGVDKILAFLTKGPGRLSRIQSVALDESSHARLPRNFPIDPEGPVMGIQSFLAIELDVGAEATGVLRLGRDEDGTWKAWTFATVLQKIKGHEVKAGQERPLHLEYGYQLGRKNYGAQRAVDFNMEDEGPTVLIVGAGQCGLSVAAHLTHMGIKTLIIEHHPRVGDGWRKRYGNLVLHDPIHMDHLPYMPFPTTWPLYTPKEKMADFLESYATLLDINVWTNSKVTNAEYDPASQEWTIEVARNIGSEGSHKRVLRPKHVIQATGLAGKAKVPDNIPGFNDFVSKDGRGIIHSTEVGDSAPAGRGDKVVVVGTGNSANDIAQACWENGAEVTIIQRGTSFIFRRESNYHLLFAPLYSENSPPNDDVDLIFMTNPFAISRRHGVFGTKRLRQMDAELLADLKAVGFETDSGPDGSGLLGIISERRRGYVNDTGCLKLVAERKIALEHSNVARITRNSIVLESGREVPATLLVMCTGYYDISHSTKDVFGEKIASQVGKVFQVDEEGEFSSNWRPTRHERFWICSQPISFTRFFSKLLALQIQATELGLVGK